VSQRVAERTVISAVTPNTDIGRRGWLVRLVPGGEIQLIGPELLMRCHSDSLGSRQLLKLVSVERPKRFYAVGNISRASREHVSVGCWTL